MKKNISNVIFVVLYILGSCWGYTFCADSAGRGPAKSDYFKTTRLLILNKSGYNIGIRYNIEESDWYGAHSVTEIKDLNAGGSLLLNKTPVDITIWARGGIFDYIGKAHTIDIFNQPGLYNLEYGNDVVLIIDTEESRVPGTEPWKISFRVQPRSDAISAQAVLPQVSSISKERQKKKASIFAQEPYSLENLKNRTRDLFEYGPFSFYIGVSGYKSSGDWWVQPYYKVNRKLHDYFDRFPSSLVGNEARVNSEALEAAVNLYKIHLAPKTSDIPRYIQELMSMISNDDTIKESLFAFKANIFSHESRYKEQDGIPKVVIYVYGKKNAQYVLDEIYKKFGNEKGSGQVPGYNEKVTDFIFFAQGNRDDKKTGLDVYDEPKKVYYNHEKLVKKYSTQQNKIELPRIDYHLKNPAR